MLNFLMEPLYDSNSGMQPKVHGVMRHWLTAAQVPENAQLEDLSTIFRTDRFNDMPLKAWVKGKDGYCFHSRSVTSEATWTIMQSIQVEKRPTMADKPRYGHFPTLRITVTRKAGDDPATWEQTIQLDTTGNVVLQRCIQRILWPEGLVPAFCHTSIQDTLHESFLTKIRGNSKKLPFRTLQDIVNQMYPRKKRFIQFKGGFQKLEIRSNSQELYTWTKDSKWTGGDTVIQLIGWERADQESSYNPASPWTAYNFYNEMEVLNSSEGQRFLEARKKAQRSLPVGRETLPLHEWGPALYPPPPKSWPDSVLDPWFAKTEAYLTECRANRPPEKGRGRVI